MHGYNENEIITINMGFVNSYIIKGKNNIILVDTGTSRQCTKNN